MGNLAPDGKIFKQKTMQGIAIFHDISLSKELIKPLVS
jgi:hypothetical protein